MAAPLALWFTWFSWGSKGYANNLTSGLTPAHANLIMDENIKYLTAAAPSAGFEHALWALPAATRDLEDPHVLFNASNPSGILRGSLLARDWKARVKSIAASVAAAQPLVKGVQIGDGLVCLGTPVSNLSAVAAALRAALPPAVFVMTNECVKELGTRPCKSPRDCEPSGAGPATCDRGLCRSRPLVPVPAGLDYISVNFYYKPFNASALWPTEAPAARAIYDWYLAPGLAAHQRVFLVPGVFGTDARPGARAPGVPNATLMAVQDERLVEKLRGYIAWAADDPRVVGLEAWHWPTLTDPRRPWRPPIAAAGEEDTRVGRSAAGDVLGAPPFPKLLRELAKYVARLSPPVWR